MIQNLELRPFYSVVALPHVFVSVMLSKLVTGNHTGCVWLNSVSPLNSLLLYNALGKHSLKEEVKSSCEFWDCNCQSRETDLMKIVFWKLTVVVLSNNVPRLQLCECLQHRKCCFSNVGSWDPTRTGCNLVNKKRCLLLWQLDMYLTHKTQSKPKGKSQFAPEKAEGYVL